MQTKTQPKETVVRPGETPATLSPQDRLDLRVWLKSKTAQDSALETVQRAYGFVTATGAIDSKAVKAHEERMKALAQRLGPGFDTVVYDDDGRPLENATVQDGAARLDQQGAKAALLAAGLEVPMTQGAPFWKRA